MSLQQFKIPLLCLLLLLSCKKGGQEPKPEPQTQLPNAAASLLAHPGYKRVKLTFNLDDPLITEVKVFWNQKANWLAVPLTANPIEMIIPNLDEGNHSFDVATYYKDGSSTTVSRQATVYGDKYIAQLQNRTVADLDFVTGEVPSVTMSVAPASEVGMLLEYINDQGTQTKLKVERSKTAVALPGYKPQTDISYKSLFLPVLNAIDTLGALPAVIPAPSYYSSTVERNVVEKSGMVKTLVSVSRKNLYKGVDMTRINYINKANLPVNISVIETDLNTANLQLQTFMGGTNYSATGTVLKMAVDQDRSGNRVIAVVNADFFTATGPWGPVVRNGQILKDNFVHPDYMTKVFFGINKNGDPVIGNESDFSTIKNDLQQAIGGNGLVVSNSKKTVYGDVDRHPRTSVGYKDGKIVYFLVADGRQTSYSMGLTLDELASLMQSLGVKAAANLDGGGSSTLVVRKSPGGALAIENRHSDAAPRAVPNGLGIISTKAE
jgi:exopolysaccharide biosynthesis protein